MTMKAGGISRALGRRSLFLSTSIVPFDPTQVTGLQLWYDAADAASITSAANKVSQWNDKSSNSRHATQATGAAQPSTGTLTLNSKNVIDFNGTTATMNITGTDTTFAAGYTTFGVVLRRTGAVQGAIIGGTNTGGFFWRCQAGGMQQQIVRTNQAVILTETGGPAFNTPAILAVQSVTAGTTIYNGGVADGSNATDPAYVIGTLANLSWLPQAWDGYYAELIVYTGTVSKVNMNLLGVYLATKWGVTWTPIP